MAGTSQQDDLAQATNTQLFDIVFDIFQSLHAIENP